MIENTCQVRVRYAETDKMAVVHHAKYFEWFEVGRTELLRALGLPYPEIEARGYFLPVIEAYCEFRASAFFDELLFVKAMMREVPRVRFRLEYEIFNEAGKLLATGFTAHTFTTHEGRPRRAPAFFVDLIAEALQKQGVNHE